MGTFARERAGRGRRAVRCRSLGLRAGLLGLALLAGPACGNPATDAPRAPELGGGEEAGRLEELAARVVEEPGLAVELTRAARASGGHETALAALKSAMGRWPENPGLPFLAAALELDLGREGAAEGHLLSALSIDPRHLSSIIRLSKVFQGSARIEEALALLREAEPWACAAARAGAAPGSLEGRKAATLLDTMGHALILLGENEEAVRRFEESLRFDPGHAEGHLGLGLARYALGDFESALEHLSEAGRIKPDHLEAAYQTMNVAERLGREEEARAARARFASLYRQRLDRAGARTPSDPPGP
jgi:tetratricopeptide (TPR) repeat protein